jgi:hypothetical protein
VVESTNKRYSQETLIMNVMNIDLFSNFTFNNDLSESNFSDIEIFFRFILPDDYKNFMKNHNGGEGFIGEQYLIIWKVSEILTYNHEYEVAKYAPGHLIFGSNGGGEAFAFNVFDGKIKILPFIGMSLEDSEYIAETFHDFIIRLSESDEIF